MSHVFKTEWYFSLLFNSLAVSLSALAGLLYTHSRLYKEEQRFTDDNKLTLKWHDYVLSLLISLLTACVVYFIIFLISGYVPMGKINNGLVDRII